MVNSSWGSGGGFWEDTVKFGWEIGPSPPEREETEARRQNPGTGLSVFSQASPERPESEEELWAKLKSLNATTKKYWKHFIQDMLSLDPADSWFYLLHGLLTQGGVSGTRLTAANSAPHSSCPRHDLVLVLIYSLFWVQARAFALKC